MRDLLEQLLEEQRETNRLLRAVLESRASMSALPLQLNGGTKTVAEVIDLYCQEQQARGAWTDKTEFELLGSYSTLKLLCGGAPLADFTRERATSVMMSLSSLPANAAKKPQYRDKSIPELLSMDIPAADRLNPRTVNKVMSRLSTALKWAVRAGHVASNAAEGLQISLKKVKANQDRDVYSQEELEAIYKKTLPWKHTKDFHRFWVPMIGMYSGLRVDEICQLYYEDVHQVDGVWVFDVNAEEDKKTKTESSKRIVPVHSKLLEMGLLLIVSPTSERVFPQLPKRRDGYSQDFSRWWGTWARKNITEEPRKVFHSLRHAVANRLKQAGVQETVISEVLGHTQQSLAMGRYGKDYDVPMLKDAIENLDFLSQIS